MGLLLLRAHILWKFYLIANHIYQFINATCNLQSNSRYQINVVSKNYNICIQDVVGWRCKMAEILNTQIK